MIKLRRGTKYFIIFLIFAVSILLGLKRSHLIGNFSQKKIVVNTSRAQEIFSKSPNCKKINMKYNVDDEKEVISKISNILSNKYSVTKFRNTKNNSLVLVAEFPDSLFSEVIPSLRKIKGLTEDNIRTSMGKGLEINVEEHLNNSKLVKEQIKEAIKNTRISADTRDRLMNQLGKVQTEIDSLSNKYIIQKQNKENDLLFLTVVRNYSDSLLGRSVKSFVITTIIVMLALSIGMFFLYFAMVFILKLMSKLGIRTARDTASGKYYNYDYNRGYYGNSHHKKVKRIYKNKKPEEEKEIEQSKS